MKRAAARSSGAGESASCFPGGARRPPTGGGKGKPTHEPGEGRFGDRRNPPTVLSC